jgi:hypothetical protein
MYFGYAGLSSYGFLAAGFWVVMVVAVGLGLVYVVGSARGKASAQSWVNLCMTALVVGILADGAWAWFSGQWDRFIRNYGFSTLLEMLLLAFLLLFVMWFMAIRYVQGLEK